MSSICFYESSRQAGPCSTPPPEGRREDVLTAEDGRGRRQAWPAWLPLFLIWLALAIPSLSAAMIVIRLMMENLPPLSPVFPVLLWSLGLVWLLYLVPTAASVILTLMRSPKAAFFWKFAAGASLAVTFIVGLGLSAAEPLVLDELWAWLAGAAPNLVAWLSRGRLWAVPPLASSLIMAVLLGLNAVWLLRLCRSGRIAAILGRPPSFQPEPPPEVSLFNRNFQTGPKAAPSPMSTSLAVYLIMVIYICLSGLVSTVSRFFFLSPYLEHQSFLGFIFNDFSFYLVLALVPLLAAVFGLVSLGLSGRRRSPLPAALLVICLMGAYSLVSSYLSLIRIYNQLPPLLSALNVIWPVIYLAASIHFLIYALKRSGR